MLGHANKQVNAETGKVTERGKVIQPATRGVKSICPLSALIRHQLRSKAGAFASAFLMMNRAP
jgi:hypothetical protein